MSKKVKLGQKLPVVFSDKKKRIVVGENPKNKSGLTYAFVMDELSTKNCYNMFKKQLPTSGGLVVLMGISKNAIPMVLGVVKSNENLRGSFEMALKSNRLEWLLFKINDFNLDGIYLQFAYAS